MFRTNSSTRINLDRLRAHKSKQINSAEFARLYDAYGDKIYRYIYYKIGSAMQAEDLTAEVFASAWQARGHYLWTGRPISAWLYRIAHNLVVDHFRTRHETISIDEVSAFDGAEPVEELAEQHLASDMVRKAMQRLPENQKKVILLRYMEEYDTDEVAKIMGRGPMAIRALQHRALHSLWRILRREAGRDWHPAGQNQVASARVAEGY